MKNTIFRSKYKKKVIEMKFYTLVIYLILAVLSSSFAIALYREEINNRCISEPRVSESHSPLTIDGNAALDAFCSERGTSGQSWSTAHVIEGYEINAVGQGGPSNPNSFGIEIKNTDRYLIIKDCYIQDAAGVGSSGGIVLLQCENINITECEFFDNEVGINLWNSNHIAISENDISECGMGVRLWDSSNSFVLNNFISQGTINGIYLKLANYNTISGNEASYNRLYGIKLDESNNNIIYDNNASYNHYDGIYLDSETENNQVYQNIVCNNELSSVNDFGSNNDIHDNNECNQIIPSFPLLWILGFISLGFIILFHKTQWKLIR